MAALRNEAAERRRELVPMVALGNWASGWRPSIVPMTTLPMLSSAASGREVLLVRCRQANEATVGGGDHL